MLHLIGWVSITSDWLSEWHKFCRPLKSIPLCTKWKLLQHPSRERGTKLLMQKADLPVTTKLYLKIAWAWLHFTIYMNKNFCKVYFFLRFSNLPVRSSKSTSSLPALFPPRILSGKFGKFVGTARRSGKLEPDEGCGALVGAGGFLKWKKPCHHFLNISHRKQ